MGSSNNLQHRREALWLPATAFMLLMGAGLLALTSPSGELVRPTRTRWVGEPPPMPPPPVPALEEVPEVVEEAAIEADFDDFDQPHREPWWLVGITFCVTLGLGLLLIFYADIPISAML